MNIAITGQNGFIGSHFLEKVERDKNFVVSLLDDKKHNLFDIQSLRDFVEKKDFIIHFAGVNRGSDQEILNGNTLITYNLISAIKEYSPKTKLFYISSVQARDNLFSVYGMSKRLTELMLKEFAISNDLSVKILRLTNVFGERCKPFYNSVVATFCYQVKHGQVLEVNPSDRKINFVYVGDVIDMIHNKILNYSQDKFTMDVMDSGERFTVGELAEVINGFRNGLKYEDIGQKFGISERFYNNLQKTYLSYLDYNLDT